MGGASRAPRERQILSVSLYSPRMKKPATYRSKLSSRASLPRAFSPVLNPANSGAEGGVTQCSGAGKLYTTSTVLSSENTPPKTVFCIDFVQFCAGPLFPNATPFYRAFRPGGPARRYRPAHQVALTAKMLSEVAPNMPDRSRRS